MGTILKNKENGKKYQFFSYLCAFSACQSFASHFRSIETYSNLVDLNPQNWPNIHVRYTVRHNGHFRRKKTRRKQNDKIVGKENTLQTYLCIGVCVCVCVCPCVWPEFCVPFPATPPIQNVRGLGLNGQK